jgi:hypothetical protein
VAPIAVVVVVVVAIVVAAIVVAALPLPFPTLFNLNSLCYAMDAYLNAVINSAPNWCKNALSIA